MTIDPSAIRKDETMVLELELQLGTKPQGQDEKGAMAGTDVEPSKTTHGEITLDQSAAAGPAVEERQEDDQEDVGQEGGQKGGGVARGETRGSDVPSRRISPLTLLSYKWGCHLRWPQRQGERGFFFFKERLCYEKAGRCTYMVKPPGFFFFFFPSQSGEDAPIW